MNSHKLHIRYNRALTQVLVKYMEKDKLTAARNEIADVILKEIIGEDWIAPPDLGEGWEDHLNDMLLNDFKAIQREVVTGKETA